MTEVTVKNVSKKITLFKICQFVTCTVIYNINNVQQNKNPETLLLG